MISDARVHELTGEKVSREKKSAKCPPSPALLLYPGFDEEEEADEDSLDREARFFNPFVSRFLGFSVR